METLSALTNETLVTQLDHAVMKERDSTLAVLFHLAEFDRRRLYVPLGYSSLFTYARSLLEYSSPNTSEPNLDRIEEGGAANMAYIRKPTDEEVGPKAAAERRERILQHAPSGDLTPIPGSITRRGPAVRKSEKPQPEIVDQLDQPSPARTVVPGGAVVATRSTCGKSSPAPTTASSPDQVSVRRV
jgi:hypothetical protein